MGHRSRRTPTAATPARAAVVRVPGLSARESEVLALLADGLSNEGIAEHLFITSKSVESVLSSVFLKLGFSQDGPEANRRVKAAVHFASTRKPPLSEPFGFDGSETLMRAAPFDTISTVFQQRASDAGTGAWLLLAAASWCTAIGDDSPGALALARRAHRKVSGMVDDGGVDRGGDDGWRSALVIVDGLLATHATMLGEAPVAHECLDRILELVTLSPGDPQRAIFDLMDPVLEIANWFTFGDRPADPGPPLASPEPSGPLR